MLDLYICQASSLSDLGHCAYELRHCATCAGAYAVCALCPSLGELCPGCRHRGVLAQIAAGTVVFPAPRRGAGEGRPPTAVGGGQADLAVDQAGAVGELTHVAPSVNSLIDDQSPDQAAMLDATPTAVYNPGESNNCLSSPTLGDAAMASPVYVLVLPLVAHDLGPVLQALAPVIASQSTTGQSNGHMPQGPAEGQRLPRHLEKKCYLSDTLCPQHHVYKDTNKALRYLGNNQCVPCSGQRTPRAKAQATPASTEG
jgi:hypothetical protein